MEKLFKIPLLEDFKQVTEEILNNLYNAEKQHSNILTEKEISQIKTDISECIIQNNFEFDSLVTLLETKQYNENKISCFISCLKDRKRELLLATLVHFNTAHGETVVDFNWFTKLILGTSEMKSMRYPLHQLVLNTVTKAGEKHEHIYDINKNMLDEMINTLESSLTT